MMNVIKRSVAVLFAAWACCLSPAKAGFFGPLEMGMPQAKAETVLAGMEGVVPPKQGTAFGNESVSMSFKITKPYPGLGGSNEILMGFDAKGGLSVLTLKSTEMFPDAKFDGSFRSKYKRLAMIQQQRFGEPVSVRMWPKPGEMKANSLMYYHVFKASPNLYVYTGISRDDENRFSLGLRFVSAGQVPGLPPPADAKTKEYWANVSEFFDWKKADEYILKANDALASKQPKEALEYFKQAAELDSPRGYWGMAFLYFGNRGISSDSKLRKECTEKAAKMGYALSMVEYGGKAVMAIKKLGITVERWNNIVAEMRRAADDGVFSAQYNLGVMYKNGYGVPKDVEKAKTYLRLASGNGDKQAQTLLSSMK